MQELFTKYKKIILGVAAFVLLFLGYSFFFGGSDVPSSSPLASPEESSVGQDLVALLATMQSLKIDTKAFTDPVYRSLQDYGRTIPSEPIGRPNPFLPLHK